MRRYYPTVLLSVFAAFIYITSCSDRSQQDGGIVPFGVGLCEMQPTVEKLANHGNVSFPASGRFVVESHLRTLDEFLSGKDGFPKTATEGIAAHLSMHCAFLHDTFEVQDCDQVYRKDALDGGQPYMRVWTPPENGGVAGQGSEAELPILEDETFIANLAWKSHHPSVPPGTKALMVNPANGLAVVVVLGYESGPTSNAKYIGGAQPAVFYFLEASGSTKLTLGILKDQTLEPGPIDCTTFGKAA